MAAGESTRFGTRSKYANFASSLPMSGEGTVIILMPFLLEENHLRKNEKFINTMLPINYFSPWTERPNGPPRRTAFIFRHCSAKPEIAAMPRWCDGHRN